MTTIEFKAELHRLQEKAEEADKRMADFIVTIICNLTILGVALICFEVLM